MDMRTLKFCLSIKLVEIKRGSGNPVDADRSLQEPLLHRTAPRQFDRPCAAHGICRTGSRRACRFPDRNLYPCGDRHAEIIPAQRREQASCGVPSGARSKQGRLADGSYGNRSEAKARKVNMRFDLPRGIDGLAAYFSEFLEIAGGTRWWKRVDQIYREGQKSPYQAKIMSDHHWLELELSAQIGIWREHGRLLPEEVFPQSMAALLFAGMTAETHKHLTTTGRNNLLGRLRDGLKTDFAGLYLELDVARGLLDEGFDIEFPDFEGAATYDIRFQNGNIVGEVECKSLSADAGRKIHRKDFYRFIDALGPKVMDYAKNSTRAVLVVTLDDRMLPDVESQRALRTAASRVLTEANLTQLSGPNFVIEREPYERRLANTDFTEPKELYDACSKAFGPNCHASGVMSETGGCFVVVRSRREDDHSKPQLE